MPLYEYKCEVGHVTEKLIGHAVAEEQKQTQICGTCQRPAYRIMSLSNFELKGTWYKTQGRY